MNLEGKLLDLIFRQVSPDRILNRLKKTYSPASGLEDAESYDVFSDDKWFEEFAESTLSGYTSHEQALLYQRLDQEAAKWKQSHGMEQTKLPKLLVPLFQCAEDTFSYGKNKEPVVRGEALLEWREKFLRLGQDYFVCAFFALQEEPREDFTWPAILRMEDSILNNDNDSALPDTSMAENHNHLGGGTLGYQTTWCREMNFPQEIRRELEDFYETKPLLMKSIRRSEDYTMDFQDRLEAAAYIRSLLFRALHKKELGFDSESAFIEEYLESFSFSNKLSDIVDQLRVQYGERVHYPDTPGFCLDYALEKDQEDASKGSPLLRNAQLNPELRLLIGERFFLYQCFLACLKKDGFTELEMQLFYLYLVLQANFRSEMIQANQETGFHNFAEYQNRKDDAWDKNPYFWEAAKIALNYRLKHEKLASLEGRNGPKPNPNDMIYKVLRFDKAKLYGDYEADLSINGSVPSFLSPSEEFDPEINKATLKDEKYYYIYHFIKQPEPGKTGGKKFESQITCRHEKLRTKQMASAIGLANALRGSDYFRSRVRGIDAANEEFLCRPEVFAVIFRYMMGIQEEWNQHPPAVITDYSPIRLGRTFHTGEDFEDIADGLRYIDEAVEYLDFWEGCRLGHCLALGTEPENHYQTKGFEVVTTKQDRLDDIIWILNRCQDYHVELTPFMKGCLLRLEKEARMLFEELYKEPATPLNLQQYWYSMRLRGDEPELYRTGAFIVPGFSGNEMTPYFYKKDSTLNSYRNVPAIARLYSRYHFDEHVRKTGRETYTFEVKKDYRKLISALQDALLLELSRKEIMIECNPSSNVLIGTFKDYGKHPILRFYNPKEKPRIKVSINTDDLGVFDTYLNFEYDLIYRTLKEKVDEDDRPLYRDEEIRKYLDKIRKMGLEMVFPKNC